MFVVGLELQPVTLVGVDNDTAPSSGRLLAPVGRDSPYNR